MGIKVGIPVLKLKPGATPSKNCGNLRKIAEEAMTERATNDPDIERKLSSTNVYAGVSHSGEEVADMIEAEAQEYSDSLVAEGGRKLRSDAVIGFSLIVKPPAEWVNLLSDSQREKFFADSDSVIAEMVGGDNIRATALHRDEQGEHKHYIGMPYTPDGRLCAKEVINLRLFHRLNDEYPAQMRQRGWAEIETCEVYDSAAARQEIDRRVAVKKKAKSYQHAPLTDEDVAEVKVSYNAEIRAKKKESGRSSREYKRDRDVEKRLASIDAVVEARTSETVAVRLAALNEREAELDEREQMLDAEVSSFCEHQEAVLSSVAEVEREAAKPNTMTADEWGVAFRGWAKTFVIKPNARDLLLNCVSRFIQYVARDPCAAIEKVRRQLEKTRLVIRARERGEVYLDVPAPEKQKDYQLSL